jgi:hypothetical protein
MIGLLVDARKRSEASVGYGALDANELWPGPPDGFVIKTLARLRTQGS